MARIVVFALGSLAIVWVSRRSLLHPASHGFPRFFAFEAILALVLVNAHFWFADPLGARQIVSWVLLVVSVLFVSWGTILLRRLGRPLPATDGAPVFGWENTTNLVTSGIFRYVRHPMYSSLLFLAWGAMLKSVLPGTLALAGVATIALTATAKLEERENVARFGDAYQAYIRRTRRFVPFVL